MKKTFMPDFKDNGQLLMHQLEGLKWTIDHAYNGSPFYRKQFKTAGVSPGDIKSLDDLSALPFTTAKEDGMSIAMSAAQAYAGAFSNAIGVYMDSFPLTPDKIFAAIKEKKGVFNESPVN